MSRVQASLSLPGSPFNLRRGSRGSHQFTLRQNRRMAAPPGDRKPLVLSTYLDAQEHLPYADDSNAVTPMSEENGAMVVPMYYANLGEIFEYLTVLWTDSSLPGSRHSSFTSHMSRMSYTSHGDLLGGIGGNGKLMTKESQLRNRLKNAPPTNYAEINHKPHRGDYVRKVFILFLSVKSSHGLGPIKKCFIPVI